MSGKSGLVFVQDRVGTIRAAKQNLPEAVGVCGYGLCFAYTVKIVFMNKFLSKQFSANVVLKQQQPVCFFNQKTLSKNIGFYCTGEGCIYINIFQTQYLGNAFIIDIRMFFWSTPKFDRNMITKMLIST